MNNLHNYNNMFNRNPSTSISSDSGISHKTLFVGDLSTVCSENDLVSAFSQYGVVTSAKIQRFRTNKKSMGYGFVSMQTEEEAEIARNNLDGQLLCGRHLRIRDAVHGVIDRNQPVDVKHSVHLKFESTNPMATTDEIKIREIFSVYAEVVDISLRKVYIDKTTLLQKGYGFVQFTTQEAADAVTNALQSIEKDGIIYTVATSDAGSVASPTHSTDAYETASLPLLQSVRI